jgi:flagellar biosynthesis GTPase FlhF
MDTFQETLPENTTHNPQPSGNKGVVIALSITIGMILLLGGCGAFVMYLNTQKIAEDAQRAREQAENAKRESERIREETERKAEAEKLAREEAERKAEVERLARAEEERLAREEQERLAREEAAKRPDGEVISVTNEADWEFVNGAADAGFKVTTVIKNNGPTGELQVVTFLSCSQGEWSRTQHLFFKNGQSMSLRYFFHEPTISVTNCQARAAVSP